MGFSLCGLKVKLGAISNDITDQSAGKYCETYIHIYTSGQVFLVEVLAISLMYS